MPIYDDFFLSLCVLLSILVNFRKFIAYHHEYFNIFHCQNRFSFSWISITCVFISNWTMKYFRKMCVFVPETSPWNQEFVLNIWLDDGFFLCFGRASSIVVLKTHASSQTIIECNCQQYLVVIIKTKTNVLWLLWWIFVVRKYDLLECSIVCYNIRL